MRLSESQVTILWPDIGGGFGQKIALYREELTIAALARALRRPVRWREDRTENLLAACHAREDVARTRAAVDREGRILALELEIVEDFGAYCFYPANYLARVVAMILTGPYRIQDYAFDIKVALTNKCGNGPMRAPMAITSWVMDGTIDAIARELGRDPIEVRRLNMLQASDLPYAHADRRGGGGRHPARDARHGAARRSTSRDFARVRRRTARAASIAASASAASSNPPPTARRSYRAAGIPGSGHEAAGSRSSRPARSTPRSG